MKVSTFLSAAVLAAAVVAAPVANAATVVKVLAAGSSAMWQTAATGAWNQLAGGPAGGAQYFTIKGTCTGSNNCAQIADTRATGIVPQTGSLWVVWNKAATQVWAYITLDSVVGNRSFFAVPRTTLQLDPLLTTGPLNSANEQLIVAGLFQGQVQATLLPTAVYNALNNATITAGFTDIRPEDAHFANCRVLNQLDSVAYTGLGYGTGTTCTTQVGTEILSAFSSSNFAQPVNFNITGTDPITHQAIKTYTTIDVGAAPIVYIVNRTNTNGLGSGLTESGGVVTGGTPNIQNISLSAAQMLLSGQQADLNLFGVPGLTNGPVNVVMREPMSGTMNTHEFSNIRCGGPTPGPCANGTVRGLSQETGINPSASGQTCPTPASTPTPGTCDNPVNIQATLDGGGIAGWRYRGIGTGELVGTGVHNITDSVGYTFFSYGNVSKLTNSSLNAPYGYLMLNGVDPISESYNTGVLPYCTSVSGVGICPAAPGSTFPHVRDGSYRAWSMLRVVTDAPTVNKTQYTNTVNLVSAIQNNVNTTTPDFVPFKPVGSDPGMTYYRSHFKQTQQLPGAVSDGLCGAKENGGDVGGYIVQLPACPAPAPTTACPPPSPSNSTNCHE